jgi:hypothetical protein
MAKRRTSGRAPLRRRRPTAGTQPGPIELYRDTARPYRSGRGTARPGGPFHLKHPKKRQRAAALHTLARDRSGRSIAQRMECAGLPALSVGPRCGAAGVDGAVGGGFEGRRRKSVAQGESSGVGAPSGNRRDGRWAI